jgi:TPR repeat protein
MPILLKTMAGLFAGAAVGAMTVAFWPQIEPAALSARPTVERPIFVSPISEAKAAPAADKAAIGKLASALRGDVSEDAASPTRSLSLTPLSADAAALRLRAQGLVSFAEGDIAGARAFLERAAEAGDARAILVLGDTYDPATLSRMGVLGLKGDASRARDYYARALSAGLAAARNRIASLETPQE